MVVNVTGDGAVVVCVTGGSGDIVLGGGKCVAYCVCCSKGVVLLMMLCLFSFL